MEDLALRLVVGDTDAEMVRPMDSALEQIRERAHREQAPGVSATAVAAPRNLQCDPRTPEAALEEGTSPPCKWLWMARPRPLRADLLPGTGSRADLGFYRREPLKHLANIETQGPHPRTGAHQFRIPERGLSRLPYHQGPWQASWNSGKFRSSPTKSRPSSTAPAIRNGPSPAPQLDVILESADYLRRWFAHLELHPSASAIRPPARNESASPDSRFLLENLIPAPRNLPPSPPL